MIGSTGPGSGHTFHALQIDRQAGAGTRRQQPQQKVADPAATTAKVNDEQERDDEHPHARGGRLITVEPEVRTTVTDPLRVSPLSAAVPGLPGRLGMTMCPGRRQRALSGVLWKRDLAVDLDRLVEVERVEVLVCLVESRELFEIGARQLRAEAERRGLVVDHFPIPDGGVPRMRPARELVARVVAAMCQGKSVAVHCAAGLGRSGTVTACILVALGVRVEIAIRAVRFVRPGAIENLRQEAFVRRFARTRHESTTSSKPVGAPNSPKVIDLAAMKAKKGAVKVAVQGALGRLDDAHRELFGAAVKLACAGPWAAWSDEQPTGTQVSFDTAMLAASGDPQVVALVGVIQAIETAGETLRGAP